MADIQAHFNFQDREPIKALFQIHPQGTATSYPSLANKPKINSVELLGDKSLEDLGITTEIAAEIAAHNTAAATHADIRALVSAEQLAREAADTNLQTQINTKQPKLTAGSNIIIANNNVISATDTTYTAGTGISIDSNNVISNTSVSAVWGNITGEMSAQTDLTSALTTLQTNLNTEITNRETAVTEEATARTQADTVLQNNITAEETARTEAVQAEATTRATADGTLQNNINAEEAARTAADTTLQNNISTEISNREEADSVLQNNINSEAAARTAADTTLQNNISTEATARTNAITSEATARETADTTLQNNINAEETARESADTLLQTNINTTNSNLAAHTSDKANPHEVTKAQVGLSDVENLAPASMPISTATQTALDTKVSKNSDITSGTYTKITYDTKGLVTGGENLAEADIPELHLSKISDVTASASEVNILNGATLSTEELNVLDGITATTTELNYVDGVTSNIQTQLNSKQPNLTAGSNIQISNDTISATDTTYTAGDGLTLTGTVFSANVEDNLTSTSTTNSLSANQGNTLNTNIETHKADKSNPHEVTKTQVGLGNCDNTSDINKPVSTATQTALDLKLNISDVVNNVATTTTNQALSANMGKTLQEEINNLNARGRFMSEWNCTTGLPETSPTSLPYTYQTGAYFIVGTVGTVNYKPDGSQYTGEASTVVETNNVAVNDTYLYDGTIWKLLHGADVQVTFASIAGQPTDNLNLASALNDKQDNLTAGNLISLENNTVSFTGTIPTVNDATLTIQKNGTTIDTFTANSSTNKTVNVTVPTQASDVNALPNTTKYGADLSYSNSSLQLKDQDGNALGTAVTIESSPAIDNTTITKNASQQLQASSLVGLTATTTELNYTDGVTSNIQTQLDGKQDTLTAGSNIDITNNTISFTGTIPTKISDLTDDTATNPIDKADTLTGLTATVTELNVLDGITATTTELNYTDGVTSNIQTQLNGKQDTLVSGTNIKTINSTSLLGSGNIDIQATPDNETISLNSDNELQAIGVIDSRDSSTALNYWTGTKAQYDALSTKDSNTLYNITDDTDITLNLLQTIYPVGSIYITTNSTCPLASLFGTWTLVGADRVLQGAGTRGGVGTTVDESLPNITGSAKGNSNRAITEMSDPKTGVFYASRTDSSISWASNTTSYETSLQDTLNFDASRSSSIYQDNAPVQPDAYLVNIYRRIA